MASRLLDLIPLATAAMAKPSGSALSLPSRYRNSLRISPILCTLDTVSFIVSILTSPYMLKMPVRQSIVLTVRDRYRYTKEASDAIHNLQKQTWLRWIFFLVGILGPAIKLASMKGVPWEKIWGILFIGAFWSLRWCWWFGRNLALGKTIGPEERGGREGGDASSTTANPNRGAIQASREGSL
jgi:hypothetical protein